MLAELGSSELSGWLAYIQLQDELQVYQMAKAFSLAFGGPAKRKPGTVASEEEEEEVIDTTSPEFAQQFQGFTGK